jgi:anti-sigma regulatory factor (Ser/Thr protein kinase)
MTTTAFEFAVRGGFHAVRVLRQHLGSWMQDMGVESAVIDDVQLAVSELAANAIEASPLGEADIQGSADAETLRLTVTNIARTPFQWQRGNGAEPNRSVEPNGTLAVRGRGLQIAAAITDHLDVATKAGRTTATLIKQLAGTPTPAPSTA